MENPKQKYYEKRGELTVRNLRAHRFGADYCATSEEALKRALELIPEGATVGWGGAMSAQQIGLISAVQSGNYNTLDRDRCKTPEEKKQLMRSCLLADVFLSGSNAVSLTGELVNIDGNGNRVAAIVYGPEKVIVIAGVNKITDTVEAAVTRARTVAAPMNKQRFDADNTPCARTGVCGDCHSEGTVCNQILITRGCRQPGRIHVILVGEELGL